METMIFLNNGSYIMAEVPEDCLLRELVRVKNELSRYPEIEELKKIGNMPMQFFYAFYFKTYKNALNEARLFERRQQGVKPIATLKEKYKAHFASNTI